MKIQSRIPTQTPRGPGESAKAPTGRQPENLPRAVEQGAARRAGFSTVSEFSRPAPDMQSEFRRQFGALASDKRRFHDTMRTVFGEGYHAVQAEQYRQNAPRGGEAERGGGTCGSGSG